MVKWKALFYVVFLDCKRKLLINFQFLQELFYTAKDFTKISNFSFLCYAEEDGKISQEQGGAGLKVTNFSLQVKRLINVVITEQTKDRTNFLISTQKQKPKPSRGCCQNSLLLLQNIENFMLWFVGVKMRLDNGTTYIIIVHVILSLFGFLPANSAVMNLISILWVSLIPCSVYGLAWEPRHIDIKCHIDAYTV